MEDVVSTETSVGKGVWRSDTYVLTVRPGVTLGFGTVDSSHPVLLSPCTLLSTEFLSTTGHHGLPSTIQTHLDKWCCHRLLHLTPLNFTKRSRQVITGNRSYSPNVDRPLPLSTGLPSHGGTSTLVRHSKRLIVRAIQRGTSGVTRERRYSFLFRQ